MKKRGKGSWLGAKKSSGMVCNYRCEPQTNLVLCKLSQFLKIIIPRPSSSKSRLLRSIEGDEDPRGEGSLLGGLCRELRLFAGSFRAAHLGYKAGQDFLGPWLCFIHTSMGIFFAQTH